MSMRAETMLSELRRAGLKLTPQRIAIVRQFASDESHPTAQDLFERLRPDFPSMSFATVYNTLDALATAGLSGVLRVAGAIDPGGRLSNATRFDPNTEPHHHAICDRCGAVRDVAASPSPPSAASVKKLHRAAPGFSVRTVERVYRGLCAACAKRSD